MKVNVYYPDRSTEMIDVGLQPPVGTCLRVRDHVWLVTSSVAVDHGGPPTERSVDVHVEPAVRSGRVWVISGRSRRLMDSYENNLVLERAEVRERGDDTGAPARFIIANVNNEEFDTWDGAMERAEEIVQTEDAERPH